MNKRSSAIEIVIDSVFWSTEQAFQTLSVDLITPCACVMQRQITNTYFILPTNRKQNCFVENANLFGPRTLISTSP